MYLISVENLYIYIHCTIVQYHSTIDDNLLFSIFVFQYMCYSGRTECSFSFTPNPQNGSMGENCIYSILAKTAVYQTAGV